MKRALGAFVALLLLLTALPVSAGDIAPSHISTETVIDTDGSDGYSGDYVVIFNPATNPNSRVSTGNMSGRIMTELQEQPAPAANEYDGLCAVDVDGELAKQAKHAVLDKAQAAGGGSRSLSFEVGDTYNFGIIEYYSPVSSYYVEFKVLAKGEHCYIWTPTSTDPNVWPLDGLDPSFAQIAADTFDQKYVLMQQYFGDHYNGRLGDGRVSLLYYNIDDGWEPGISGYVAGFFASDDLYVSGMPIVNIDTYPGVYYPDPNGEPVCDISRTFNTMVHEYQHLINYSECGDYTEGWINECMSAAAEEICFPGSSVSRRIMSWINYDFRINDDWDAPPEETEYEPSYELQNGFPLYSWTSGNDISDTLVMYAQVSLFAQYIYSNCGNAFFRSLMQQLADGSNFVAAYNNITGQSAADLAEGFRVALTANTTQDEFGGRFGFKMQPGYDPSAYHDVQNLYSLLCPVVFTGTSCMIGGCGAICVKPVDGVYYPPAGASSALRYYGITRTCAPAEPVELTGVELDRTEIELLIGGMDYINAIVQPENASNYTLEWSVSDRSVIDIDIGEASVRVSGLAPGTATVTVTAHDNVTGETYTAEAAVTVLDQLLGDVDGNGTVDANDALMVLRASLGLITLTPEQQARADVDGNGTVNANDALWIMRRSLGLL